MATECSGLRGSEGREPDVLLRPPPRGAAGPEARDKGPRGGVPGRRARRPERELHRVRAEPHGPEEVVTVYGLSREFRLCYDGLWCFRVV